MAAESGRIYGVHALCRICFPYILIITTFTIYGVHALCRICFPYILIITTFTIYGSTAMSSNLSLEPEQACLFSTLLYGSETWPTYSVQEQHLNIIVCQCHLRTIMHVTWKDHVSNHDILAKGKILSLHALISQKRLRWLGHVTRMEDGGIPKEMLCSELCLGTRPTGRPALRFKDVCKRDMKACNINTSSWETAAHNRTTWKKITRDGMKKNDEKHQHKWQEMRHQPPSQLPANPALNCNNCSKVCGSRIGLHSHRIRCTQK